MHIQNGAIPKGHSKGATGTAYAQTARLRILTDGRVAGEGPASVRYYATERKIRRDGKLAEIGRAIVAKGGILLGVWSGA